MRRQDNSPHKRVTLEDIAKIAGISRSAVSKAMRDHPEVSRDTCKRIQKIAKEIGYVRDPALSRLSQYRWGSTSPSSGESVAYIFPRSSPRDKPQVIVEDLKLFFQEEGFAFHTFHAKDYTTDQLARVLRARGIRAVIFHRVVEPEIPLHLCNSGFVCVAVAEGPIIPPCELIRPDYVWCLNDAIRRHRDAGYKHLVFICGEGNRESELFLTLKAIWRNAGLPVKSILLHVAKYKERLQEQLRAIQPDAFICHTHPLSPEKVWQAIGYHDPNREIVLHLRDYELGKINGYFISNERLARRAAHYLESRLKHASNDELYGKILLRPEWVPANDPPLHR